MLISYGELVGLGVPVPRLRFGPDRSGGRLLWVGEEPAGRPLPPLSLVASAASLASVEQVSRLTRLRNQPSPLAVPRPLPGVARAFNELST